MKIRSDVPPDGNCFFHCIQDQLRRLALHETDHSHLRKKVHAFLRNLPADDPLKPHATEQCLETLDHIKANIQRRFQQHSLELAKQMEKLLPQAADGKCADIPTTLSDSCTVLMLTPDD
ncbi:hypothetical protein ACOMHN_005978 [Nucella lapillus]